MNKPIVSVIMSAYNHERFVASAMRSVMNQTLEEFEFLIADDGSQDSTADVIEKYVNTLGDPRIRFSQNEQNRGAYVVLNELLDECRGDFIALINSDDVFEPHKLERQLGHITADKNLAASFTWVKLIDESGQPFEDCRNSFNGLYDQRNRTRAQWLQHFFYEGNCLCHPTIMARRKKFNLRFDTRLCKLPDLDMWVRLLMEENIEVLPQRLTRFRVRADESNLSGYRPDTLSLIQLELPVVLDHFAHLSADDCEAVFGYTGSEAVRAYAACTAALDGPPAARAWGIRGLFTLLGNEKAHNELSILGFDEGVLFRLGAKEDVYSVLPHRAQLYYADAAIVEKAGAFVTDAFEEQRSFTLPASSYYLFAHKFELHQHVQALRFDPAAQPCRVRLKHALLKGPDGPPIDLLKSASHNGKEESGWVLFESFDPSFFFLLEEAVTADQLDIAGEWSFIDPAKLLHRYGVS